MGDACIFDVCTSGDLEEAVNAADDMLLMNSIPNDDDDGEDCKAVCKARDGPISGPVESITTRMVILPRCFTLRWCMVLGLFAGPECHLWPIDSTSLVVH